MNTKTSTIEIKPYCSICAKKRDFESMKLTHKESEHELYFELLGNE